MLINGLVLVERMPNLLQVWVEQFVCRNKGCCKKIGLPVPFGFI